MKLFSKGCEYAFKVFTNLDPVRKGQRFSLKKICQQEKISESFTRKVFQGLVHNGFLKAVSGPGGGYILSKSPRSISVYDIISNVDGKDALECCVMGLPRCDSKKPCCVHHTWIGLKEQMIFELKGRTLAELIQQGQANKKI